MAMTYSSLVGPKGSAGSVANWVGYSKLDIPTTVDEAQSLIYSLLRVREMRTEWTFGMNVGQSEIALPTGFLDPIGRLYDVTNSSYYPHKIETDIVGSRAYDEESGSLGTDPFTTAVNSSVVNVQQTGHDFTQGSTFFASGANAVGGLALNNAFPVVAIVDADNFTIDTGTLATSTATGGGASVTYTGNVLISSSPSRWTIWDEAVKFDTAFDTQTTLKQLYYKSPPLLSTSNQSNWLVNRYPMLMRIACMAAAANFMKDDTEYQKQIGALNNLVGTIAAENDMGYRGMEFGTDTPGTGYTW